MNRAVHFFAQRDFSEFFILTIPSVKDIVKEEISIREYILFKKHTA